MSAYQRAVDDPAFLERFARAYGGTAEPLDALWWSEHPEEAAPSGAAAPAVALAELWRAMYAPGTDAGVREQYARLRAAEEREADAVRAALLAASGGGAATRPATYRPTVSAPASVLQVAAPSRAAGLRRRWPVLLGSGAVAAAFAAGLLVAPALGESAAPRPTPSPTGSDAGPFISGSSGTGSALGVFGEPQRDVDRPPIGVAAHLLPQTFRRMQAVPLRGVDVYAAEDSAGDICLVAVAVDARIAVTCTSIADWRKAPIRLEFPASAYLDTGVRVRDQVDLVATWGFLGPFDLQESPLSAGE